MSHHKSVLSTILQHHLHNCQHQPHHITPRQRRRDTTGRRASITPTKVETMRVYKVRLVPTFYFILYTYYVLESTEPRHTVKGVYPSSQCRYFRFDTSRRLSFRPSKEGSTPSYQFSRHHSCFDVVRRVYPSSSHHHSCFNVVRWVYPSSSRRYSRFNMRRVYPSSLHHYSCFNVVRWVYPSSSRRDSHFDAVRRSAPPFCDIIPILTK
jgi:hypothetical protein